MGNLDLTFRRLTKDELRSSEYSDFIAAIWGKKKMEAKLSYWDWLYGENPFSDSEKELPVFCGFYGKRLIGQLGVIPVKAVVEDEFCKAGWCMDFYILKEFQRQGVGGKLLSAAFDSFPLLMTLGQTDASRNLLLKKHWHYSGSMIRHMILLKPLHIIAKKLIGKTFSPAVIKPRNPDGNSLLCEKLCAMVKENRHQRVGILHDKEYLTWRYEKIPLFNYEVNKFETERGQYVYVIWRLDQRNLILFAIVQEVIHPPDIEPTVLRDILKDVIKIARKRGAEVFECQTSNQTLIKAMPRRLTIRKQGSQFLYGSKEKGKYPPYPIKEWKLSQGDCDIDFWSEVF